MIDFNDVSEAVTEAFQNYLQDLETFFMILSTEYITTLYPRESLLIFNEIQRFPKARQSVKKLVKDGRFDYVETGSLVSIRENVQDITIPSDERKIKMYPMDFEEFCWALEEEGMANYIRKCFEEGKPLTDQFHKKAMLLYRQYLVVGGMPQSVVAYLENSRSFQKSDEEKIDFLISNKSKTRYRVYPIEVKSAERYSITSLERFIEKFRERIGQAYVIDTKNYRSKDGIVYIPAYMAMCL